MTTVLRLWRIRALLAERYSCLLRFSKGRGMMDSEWKHRLRGAKGGRLRLQSELSKKSQPLTPPDRMALPSEEVNMQGLVACPLTCWPDRLQHDHFCGRQNSFESAKAALSSGRRAPFPIADSAGSLA